MANVIIDNGLKDVSEVWGSEVSLYYEELYAGTTDLVGVSRRTCHNGFQTITKAQEERVG